MYVKEIQINNYGAIKDMEYKFKFSADGNPKPVVFIGANGTGKTLLLSIIVDSLIEMKRNFYNDIPEVSGDNYYRVASKRYIRSNENSAYSRVVFNNKSFYTDLMVYNYDKFKDGFNPKIYQEVSLNNPTLIKNGFYKNVKSPNENVFEKEVFLYFPIERCYIPTWENRKNDKLMISFNNTSYLGYDNNTIIKTNLLQDIESWVLDVLLDKNLFEMKLIPNNNFSPGMHIILGKNTNIVNAINQVLNKVFINKYNSVHIGVTPKYHGTRQIHILGIENNQQADERMIVPTFSNLSSGEVMILGLILSILKSYDNLSDISSVTFDSMNGVVLIDEIDLHLHSDLLKDVLPSLIKMFPRIQFIITSHSPFFLFGMKETFGDECEFVIMPTGTITNHIEHFDEVEKCYSIIDDNYKKILSSLQKANEQLKIIKTPLIITEGKTDWKHIEHALSVFKKKGLFTDLDIAFLQYDFDLGDSKLESLLKNLSKISHANKIIGIFDSDSDIGKKYSSAYNFENNVYGCCIQDDAKRYNCGISIELLYSREDLKTCDETGRRLYLSDEFTEKSHQLKENSNIVCNNGTLIDAYKRGLIKIVDSGVFDNEENSLALSKSDFADYIYNEDGNFANVDVSSFKNILESIQSICKGEV